MWSRAWERERAEPSQKGQFSTGHGDMPTEISHTPGVCSAQGEVGRVGQEALQTSYCACSSHTQERQEIHGTICHQHT